MEDRETARMRKYGESKTTRIMMSTVHHVTSGLGQKISGRWIFVDTSVHEISRDLAQCSLPVFKYQANYTSRLNAFSLIFPLCLKFMEEKKKCGVLFDAVLYMFSGSVIAVFIKLGSLELRGP